MKKTTSLVTGAPKTRRTKTSRTKNEETEAMRTKVWNLALEGVGATEAMRTMVWNLALDAIGASSAFRIVFSQPGSDAVIDGEGRKPLTVERMRTNNEVRAILTEAGRPWARTTAVRTAAQADDLIIEIGRTDEARVAAATNKTALALELARCMAELGQMSKQPDTEAADLMAEIAKRDQREARRQADTAKRGEEQAQRESDALKARQAELRRAGSAKVGANSNIKREALRKVMPEMLKAKGADKKRSPLKIQLNYDENSKAKARELMIAAGVDPGKDTYPSKNIFVDELSKARKLLKTGN